MPGRPMRRFLREHSPVFANRMLVHELLLNLVLLLRRSRVRVLVVLMHGAIGGMNFVRLVHVSFVNRGEKLFARFGLSVLAHALLRARSLLSLPLAILRIRDRHRLILSLILTLLGLRVKLALRRVVVLPGGRSRGPK